MAEAEDLLVEEGVLVDALRIRAFPFGREVGAFIDAHDRIFIVEQNRDAQMRTLLMADFEKPAHQFHTILHFDGTPNTARFIRRELTARTRARTAPRFKEVAS